MKPLIFTFLFLFLFQITTAEKTKVTKKSKSKITEEKNTNLTSKSKKIKNPLIDYPKFQKIVNQSYEERETHRLKEDEFLKIMGEEGVIVLDARSENRFKLLHIKGAKNLPFTEFTENTLKETIPDKKVKILIYCNNNFEGSPEAFAAKAPAASLNLSTYNSLKAYGYKKIYELGPLLNTKTTILPLEGEELETQKKTEELN